jgi:hypothetical protein
MELQWAHHATRKELLHAQMVWIVMLKVTIPTPKGEPVTLQVTIPMRKEEGLMQTASILTQKVVVR